MGEDGAALPGQAGRSRAFWLRQSSLPGWKLIEEPPVGPQWVHEIKWDGYRVSANVADGKATIRTCNGHDWTARLPAIAAAAALKVRSAVLDGEAVILDERGRSSFAALQAGLDRHAEQDRRARWNDVAEGIAPNPWRRGTIGSSLWLGTYSYCFRLRRIETRRSICWC